MPVRYEKLLETVGPSREIDVSAWRRSSPGGLYAEIPEKMNFDPRAKVERLPPDRSYLLVPVEGL